MAAAVTVKVDKPKLQAGTERTFYTYWTISGSKKNLTDKFEWEWRYKVKSGKKEPWFAGQNGDTDYAKSNPTFTSTYQLPDNAYVVEFRIKPIAKTKKNSKGKEVPQYKTPSWTSVTTEAIKDVLVKGKYTVTALAYDPESLYPLVATVKGTRSDKKEADTSWATSFDATWEFLVKRSGQSVWETGSTTTHHRGETSLEYTGTIPDGAKEVRIILKPISEKISVIAEETAYKNDKVLADGKKKRSVTGLNIQLKPQGDREVVARWSMDSRTNLTGFSYMFQTYRGSGSLARWMDDQSGTVDYNTYTKVTKDRVDKKGKKVTKNGKVLTDDYYYWVSGSYTFAEEANQIRVVVTPTSSESSGYTESPKTATYTPSIEVLEMDTVKYPISLDLLSSGSRTLIALWNKANDDRIASYECRWSYSIMGSSVVIQDTIDTVNIDTKASDGRLYCQYTPADNVKVVYFEVRPMPKYSNAFVGAWTAEKSYTYSIPIYVLSAVDVVWPEQDRTSKTAYATWNTNNWTTEQKSKLLGYEVRWRYAVRLNEVWKGKDLVQDGDNKTISYVDIVSDSYTAPDNAVKAQVSVRPLPKEELYFSGGWSSWRDCVFELLPRHIREGSITIDYAEDTDRSVQVGFSIDDTTHVLDYTYCYRTYTRGVWSETTEGNTSYQLFEVDIPEGIDTFAIRIKPNDESGNDVYFKGEYSNYAEFNVDPDHREVVNLDVFAQRGSSSSIVATWEMEDMTDVDSFSYKWQYFVDNIWFDGDEGTTSSEVLACIYDAPAQAELVRVKVTPVPKYSMSFIGEESLYVSFPPPAFSIPDTPNPPTLSVNQFTLIATVDDTDDKAGFIEFEIVAESLSETYATGQTELIYDRATFITEIEPGYGFRGRCRGVNDAGEPGEWSEYSSEVVYSTPLPPEISEVNALSATSVEVLWNAVDGASSYVIQRTTKSRYFDAAPDHVDETTISSGTRAEITGLEPKDDDDNYGQWFFRMKAVSDSSGESEWSEIVSAVLGTIPEAPTTWSSAVNATVPDDIYLNWLHNSADGSRESAAELELTVNGVAETHLLIDDLDLKFGDYHFEDANSMTGMLHLDGSEYRTENLIPAIQADVFSLENITEKTTVRYITVNGQDISERMASWEYVFVTDENDQTTITEAYVKTNTVVVESEGQHPTLPPAYISVTIDLDDVWLEVLGSTFLLNTSGGVSYYMIPGNTYSNGTVLTWRVRTKGVLDDFGDWSVTRQVNIYVPPVIRYTVSSGENWLTDDFVYNDANVYDTLEGVEDNEGVISSFPLIMNVMSGPTSQTPVVYTLSILANESYDDTDETGKYIHVRAGQEVYKRYIYTNKSEFMTLIRASDVNLDNTYTYDFVVSVNMDSGLNAESRSTYLVDLAEEEELEFDAPMFLDEDNAVLYIEPVVLEPSGVLPSNIEISIFRQEFDGGFTPICRNIPNTNGITITDPHPTLDWGRYRMLATDTRTGRTLFEDLPPESIHIPSIIIQWDETWVNYDVVTPGVPVESAWRGSILRLPYNVDETDSNELDVEMVNYIGRKHPVSYYGTHVGQTTSWKTEIPKSDKNTIFALRRLAAWPGDAYVRSPSGVGYWAHVDVSYDITHLAMTVPVTLNITRVEGGM